MQTYLHKTLVQAILITGNTVIRSKLLFLAVDFDLLWLQLK